MSTFKTMSVFERQEFEAFIIELAAVEIVHQWGEASVGKVGGKIFAIYSAWSENEQWQIAFKCSDIGFEMLPQLDGVKRAKYLARAKWVEVLPGSELAENEVKAYIVEAHRLVASKLTRRAKNELGLTGSAFNKKSAAP